MYTVHIVNKFHSISMFLFRSTYFLQIGGLAALWRPFQDPMAAVGGLLFGGPQLLRGHSTKTLAGSVSCGLVARRLYDEDEKPSEMVDIPG